MPWRFKYSRCVGCVTPLRVVFLLCSGKYRSECILVFSGWMASSRQTLWCFRVLNPTHCLNSDTEWNSRSERGSIHAGAFLPLCVSSSLCSRGPSRVVACRSTTGGQSQRQTLKKTLYSNSYQSETQTIKTYRPKSSEILQIITTRQTGKASNQDLVGARMGPFYPIRAALFDMGVWV